MVPAGSSVLPGGPCGTYLVNGFTVLPAACLTASPLEGVFSRLNILDREV
jgi:hypothetical protein